MGIHNILFIVFISIFSITALITLLGITNIIKSINAKYLNVLFSSLILEVVGAIIVLFNSSNFNEEKQIPNEFYEISSIDSTGFVDRDINAFSDLIIKGEKYDDDVKKLNEEIKRCNSELEITKVYYNDFYSYIQELDELRSDFNGSINLKYESSNAERLRNKEKVLELVGKILFIVGRLNGEENPTEKIIEAFEKFKIDNERPNDKPHYAYTIFLQDVPLFVKEFLEEKYELKFVVVSES